MSTTGQLTSSSLLIFTVYFMLEGQSKNAQLQAPDATPTGCSFQPAMTQHIAPECLICCGHAVVSARPLPLLYNLFSRCSQRDVHKLNRFHCSIQTLLYTCLSFWVTALVFQLLTHLNLSSSSDSSLFLSWLFLLQTHCPPVTGLFSNREVFLGFS